MPSLHYTEATLPDGRVAWIESYTVAPDKEQAFANFIAMAHPDAALITHDLLMLRREGASYFGDDEAPQLSHDYEYCDLATKERHVLWMTLRAKNSHKRHLVGLLEWRHINPAEAVITGIYVGRQFRRLGIATEVMLEAVHQMKADNYSAALAFVPVGNGVASDFFASRDFQLASRADIGEDELWILNLDQERLFE